MLPSTSPIADRLNSTLTVVGSVVVQFQRRTLENPGGVSEIEAARHKVRLAFGLVPLEHETIISQ